jgi:hypothetical protein
MAVVMTYAIWFLVLIGKILIRPIHMFLGEC